MSEDDLSLIDTDDLLREIKKRYDTFAFIGLVNRTDMEMLSHYDWNTPSILEAVGAVEWLKKLMLRQWGKSRRPPKED